MVSGFITLGLFDILDILVVAFLFYQLYLLIKGTVAINIFAGLFSFYLLWLLVKALNMELLGSILGQFIGVGVIALIIVFQQEIRRFLLMIGIRYNFKQRFTLENLFSVSESYMEDEETEAIIEACKHMSRSKTGALIVIGKLSRLSNYASNGQILKAKISSSALESIFFKNSPLHDGAVIIENSRILAARCILPLTDAVNVPENLGLRHRAGIGMTEATDAHVIIISEETGYISYAMGGNIKIRISSKELKSFLQGDFTGFAQVQHAL